MDCGLHEPLRDESVISGCANGRSTSGLSLGVEQLLHNEQPSEGLSLRSRGCTGQQELRNGIMF